MIGKKSYFTSQFALLATCAIWGWTFVLVKESVREVPPFLFLFVRFTLASVVLALLFRRPLLEQINGHVIVQGCLIGFALAVGYFFQTKGLMYTTVTKSGFITGLAVVLVPILRSILGKPVEMRAWLGTILAMIGLAFFLLGKRDNVQDFDLNIGDFYTFLCALSYACHLLLIERFVNPREYHAVLVVQIVAVAVFTLLGTLVFEPINFHFSPVAWQGIVITGLFATAFAFWAQNKYQPLISATTTALLFSTEPVFTGLFGYWLLNERLVLVQVIGAGLILMGIVAAQISRKT